MNDTTGIERLPRGVRLVRALQKEPDWSAMTGPELITYRERANRVAGSRLLRVVTGFPDRRAKIRWQEIALADRVLPVRVYRPAAALDPGTPLPLVLHVHGGGFVGTAAQCDWASSHLAAQLPAVVMSVEHRLLAPGTPLPAAVA
ncbi:MAG: alpha/beta hydrolase fold domain-containing protein, partial [Nocardia sp.]|nr:alpha/beta hydrolase fold domain-containing protein [Nocardia sp.]